MTSLSSLIFHVYLYHKTQIYVSFLKIYGGVVIKIFSLFIAIYSSLQYIFHFPSNYCSAWPTTSLSHSLLLSFVTSTSVDMSLWIPWSFSIFEIFPFQLILPFPKSFTKIPHPGLSHYLKLPEKLEKIPSLEHKTS